MGTKKVAVVTGASTGIGFATAKQLAKLGWHVVMVSRDVQRAQLASSELVGHDVVQRLADLAKQSEVARLATWLQEQYPRIDVLVNCAGAFYADRRETEDGHEMTLAINHLAPYQLSCLLLETLRKTKNARVINVSTRFYASEKIDLNDFQNARKYRSLRAYSRAKLANLLCQHEFARLEDPSLVTFNAVMPGDVHTNVAQNSGWLLRTMYQLIAPLFFLSPDEGADSIVWAATSESMEHVTGTLISKRRAVTLHERATSEADSKQVWTRTEQLTGVRRSRGTVQSL